MHQYNNILYVSHGTGDEGAGLKQALYLAQMNNAPMNYLIVCPEFPSDLSEYQQKFQQNFIEHAQNISNNALNEIKKELKLENISVALSFEILYDKMPALKIIQHVLKHGHDVVIKEAQPLDMKSGFKAIDFDLTRKCPTPLWLCRSRKREKAQLKIAVAIDPKGEESIAEELSRALLKYSQTISNNFNGELQIISCWDDSLELELKSNTFLKIPDEAIQKAMDKARNQHYQDLQKVITDSNISGKFEIHHLPGQPDNCIPNFVKENAIDILVMGTVARTGLSGFIFGNTAENIMQKLSCSLVALKPKGFVSSVTAY